MVDEIADQGNLVLQICSGMLSLDHSFLDGKIPMSTTYEFLKAFSIEIEICEYSWLLP